MVPAKPRQRPEHDTQTHHPGACGREYCCSLRRRWRRDIGIKCRSDFACDRPTGRSAGHLLGQDREPGRGRNGDPESTAPACTGQQRRARSIAPVYKTETRQQVVQPRRETWYEIICDADVTPEFIASVQRALEARGFYDGQITGEMDARTKNAIGRYQATEGLDSKTLSIAAARKLGLITIANPGAT